MENEFEKNETGNVFPDRPEAEENGEETVLLTESDEGSETAAEMIAELAEGSVTEPETETPTPPYFNNLSYTPRAQSEPAPGGQADMPTPPPFGGNGRDVPTSVFYRSGPIEEQGYSPVGQRFASPAVPQYGQPGAPAAAPRVAQHTAELKNYGVPDVKEGRVSYNPAPHGQAPKAKKNGGKGWVAILVAVCVLLSFGAGFLGAYAAGLTGAVRTNSGSADGGSSSGAPIIRQVEPTDVSDKEPSAGSGVYADVVSEVADSVVEVYTEYTTTGWFRYIVSGGGSGVIISEDGYIVTNNHVVMANDDVTPAESVKVRTRSGEEYPATIIGGDADADIAVIKIEATGLSYATFGDSDSLAVGDEVIAIGNPLGELGGTVTNGIISALARDITVEGNDMTLLQTNTAINPGNSGGGLFNLKGELIGITNAVSDASVEGISFAIPGNEALAMAKQIMEKGPTSSNKTIIGVTLYTIDSAYKASEFGVNSLGVYVYEVKEGYNDDVLKVKDRILAVNGVEVASGDDVIKEIRKHEPGEKIEITLFRDGDVVKVEVTCFESNGDA